VFCEVGVLEDNEELRIKLEEKALPKKEYFQFKTEDGEGKNYVLQCRALAL